MMSEKKESKRSQNTFPDCPHLFSPEIKPVITGKGKSFIAPATFSAALSPNGENKPEITEGIIQHVFKGDLEWKSMFYLDLNEFGKVIHCHGSKEKVSECYL